MPSPARSFVCFRTLGLLVVGCLAFSVTGERSQADKRASGQVVGASNAASERSAAVSKSASPILFDGWRRTTNGWEQLPFKNASPSINDWIANQREEEARNPLTQPLKRLGKIHPIRIAAAEVALACLIAVVASDRRIWTAE